MYLRAVLDPKWRGAFNAVSPAAVTNAEFTATLARVLRRPAVFPVPAAVLKLIFGEMAEETLLASTRAVPDRAARAEFVWRQPELESALRHVLGRKG
jgi:NAD dependent epimerase/dehydratase family enzyme